MVAVHGNRKSGARLKPLVGRKGGYEIDQGEATNKFRRIKVHDATPFEPVFEAEQHLGGQTTNVRRSRCRRLRNLSESAKYL